MRSFYRVSLLMLALAGGLAACDTVTVPPLPGEEEDEDPDDEDPDGEDIGFIFQDEPAILA